MTKELLWEFYDRKYSHEKEIPLDEIIIKKSIPTTRFEAVVKFFPKYFQGGDIIELASGNGIIAKSLLSSNMEISSYTASEISLSRLTGLYNNLKDNRLSIIELDAENIPETEYGKYDAIIMVALIDHLIDPLLAMQKIRRLLKPNGFVYIDTHNIAKYTRRIKLLLGRFPSTASKNEGLTSYNFEPVYLFDEGHFHYFTYRSLSLMLTQRCGFSRVIKLSYPTGRIILGKHIHNFFAKIWPELFSELLVIAYE